MFIYINILSSSSINHSKCRQQRLHTREEEYWVCCIAAYNQSMFLLQLIYLFFKLNNSTGKIFPICVGGEKLASRFCNVEGVE